MIRFTTQLGKSLSPQHAKGHQSSIPLATFSSGRPTVIKPVCGRYLDTDCTKGSHNSGHRTIKYNDNKDLESMICLNRQNDEAIRLTTSNAMGAKSTQDFTRCFKHGSDLLLKSTGLLWKQLLNNNTKKTTINCIRYKCSTTHDGKDNQEDIPSFFDQPVILDEAKVQLLDASNHSNTEDGELIPPDPETCCGSGCVNCVYIKYVQDVLKKDPNDRQKVKAVLDEIEDFNVRMFIKMELGL